MDSNDLLRVQPVLEGAAQLVGQHRQRLRLAQPRRQSLREGAEALVLLGREHRRRAEGPLQPGVAGLAIAHAGALAVGLLDGAAQPGGGAELLPCLEALDGVDLRHEYPAAAVDRAACSWYNGVARSSSSTRAPARLLSFSVRPPPGTAVALPRPPRPLPGGAGGRGQPGALTRHAVGVARRPPTPRKPGRPPPRPPRPGC